MQKDKIQLIQLQAAQAVPDEARYGRGRIHIGGVRIEPAAALGGYIEAVRMRFQVAAYGLLALAAVVYVRRVDKSDAAFVRRLKYGHGLFFVERLAPFCSELPGAEPDLAHFAAGVAENPFIHTLVLMPEYYACGRAPYLESARFLTASGLLK